MSRLDQLAQPTRRNGVHIRSVLEKQRQFDAGSTMNQSFSVQSSSHSTATTNSRSMSRSTTHLADTTAGDTATPIHRRPMSSTPQSAKLKSNASTGVFSLISNCFFIFFFVFLQFVLTTPTSIYIKTHTNFNDLVKLAELLGLNLKFS